MIFVLGVVPQHQCLPAFAGMTLGMLLGMLAGHYLTLAFINPRKPPALPGDWQYMTVP